MTLSATFLRNLLEDTESFSKDDIYSLREIPSNYEYELYRDMKYGIGNLYGKATNKEELIQLINQDEIVCVFFTGTMPIAKELEPIAIKNKTRIYVDTRKQ